MRLMAVLVDAGLLFILYQNFQISIFLSLTTSRRWQKKKKTKIYFANKQIVSKMKIFYEKVFTLLILTKKKKTLILKLWFNIVKIAYNY